MYELQVLCLDKFHRSINLPESSADTSADVPIGSANPPNI